MASLAVSCVSAHPATETDEQTAASVRAVLQTQQAAWDRGDIDGFMDGYDRSDATTFVSADEITQGWQKVLERYKQRYKSREEMGKLTFSELSVKSLAPDFALVDGHWELMRASDKPHGRFTLLFQRINNNWRIVHDTTTSGTP